jgi:glycosyltransferase involved in cell wall biosynthesis
VSTAVKVALIVPAYNAASTLPRLLDTLGTVFDKGHVLVIDDGSTDGTSALCGAAGVTVVRHAHNAGKGAALRTGFQWALARGYEAVLTMDADGQHDPAEVPRFLSAADAGQADILIGSRMHRPAGMPWQRRLSNRLTSCILSWRTGQRIRDSQSGYRLIRAQVLARVSLETSRFQTESELLIKAGLQGFRIDAIPVQSIYRASASAIQPFLDTWRFVVLVARSMTWKRNGA